MIYCFKEILHMALSMTVPQADFTEQTATHTQVRQDLSTSLGIPGDKQGYQETYRKQKRFTNHH